MRKYTSLTLLSLILIGVVVAFSAVVGAQQRVGPGSESITFKRYPVAMPDAIAAAFQAGELHAYIFGLRPAQLDAFKPVEGIIKYVTAPAGLLSIILNPAPIKIVNLSGDQTSKTPKEIANMLGVPENIIVQYYYDSEKNVTFVDLAADGEKINPLGIKRIRFALNYIANRDYIVNTLYRGYASPMYTFLSAYDPDYALIVDIILSYNFKYDVYYARKIVSEEMTKAGAYLVGGKWYYAGNPVVLKFIIRIEDERLDIGKEFSKDLQFLGFTIDETITTFDVAIGKVYDTDPAEFEWHLYTEGWGKGAPDKYDAGTINQMCAPWVGYMPGWQTEGWWWYRNDFIDEYGKNIYLGKFTSKEERNAWYRDVTKACIEDAIRIWLATSMSIHPVVKDMGGITTDLGAGMRSPYNTKGVYVPRKPDLTFGHLWVYTARTIWNIYGGFTDVYSVDIQRATYDPMLWPHPHNGLPIPIRSEYEVITAGPDGKLPIPSDAIWWDASRGKWVYANALGRVNATSLVKYDMSKYVGTKWHHGITITWADILASWALWLDIVYNETKANYETPISGPNKPLFDTIKALRIVGNTLEVYVDYWHFEPAYIASYATLTPINPVELLVVENYLVFDSKHYTFSTPLSRTTGLPVLNPVPFPDHAASIKSVADSWKETKYLPSKYFILPDGTNLMSSDEWSSRLSALSAWIEQHKHAWISQGPFYLDTFDRLGQQATIRAFRDPTYPFTPDFWNLGGIIPPRISDVIAPASIEIGSNQTISLNVLGVGPFSVKYILREKGTNKIMATGSATEVEPGVFEIFIGSDVTSEFRPYYYYELILIGISEAVAVIDTTIVTFESVPSLAELEKSLRGAISDVAEQTQRQMEELRASLSAALGVVGETLVSALNNMSNSMTYLINITGSTLLTNMNTQYNTLSSKMDGALGRISTLESRVDDLSESVGDLSSAVGSLTTYVTVVLVISIINLIAGVVLPFIRKK
ncbi:MAG: ABC transporter substrate-binding protein [Desulfurococcaceae archaeon TW002]